VTWILVSVGTSGTSRSGQVGRSAWSTSAADALRAPRRRGLAGGPRAVVFGDLDLISTLGMAGIACVAVAPPGDPVRFSRFTRGLIELPERPEADELVKRLRAFAQSQPTRPVLYYQDDEHLILVSRQRETLGEFARYVLPDEQLVEDLVDKVRFRSLAERLEFPVPRSRSLSPRDDSADLGDLTFPLVLKPSARQSLDRLQYDGKALAVESRESFLRLWPQLASAGIELIAQEMITGTEASVESYHAYVDSNGRVAGEFTGAKLRTRPSAMGFSTAVRTTRAEDLVHAGRDLVERLRFRGVLKADYKRDARGCLHLLEVNPRFSLWHHLGDAAGVNLHALVYADLTGMSRPEVGAGRSGPYVVPTRRRPPSRSRAGGGLACMVKLGGCYVRPSRGTVDQSHAADSRSAWSKITPRLRCKYDLVRFPWQRRRDSVTISRGTVDGEAGRATDVQTRPTKMKYKGKWYV